MIFGLWIHLAYRLLFRRCDQVRIKIDRLCHAARKLNPKEVAIRK